MNFGSKTRTQCPKCRHKFYPNELSIQHHESLEALTEFAEQEARKQTRIAWECLREELHIGEPVKTEDKATFTDGLTQLTDYGMANPTTDLLFWPEEEGRIDDRHFSNRENPDSQTVNQRASGGSTTNLATTSSTTIRCSKYHPMDSSFRQVEIILNQFSSSDTPSVFESNNLISQLCSSVKSNPFSWDDLGVLIGEMVQSSWSLNLVIDE